ncbi:sterile alpha motif domain-containing 3-like protein [Labeo rohita]|uniref:1-alkyl-2-acetylglycerophosphocholine esterase n=1 Tax=Labeo rohita TaxID=84645 RepID=A0A498NKZ9_LABRO|nr:sterile alpha motif domain-containing 3-like protein [Labeo rohita]
MTRGKLVLIVGHSFVKWAERRAEAAWEPHLGLRSTNVQWYGEGGMKWSQILPVVLSTGLRPDVLVIHAGGNDLGLQRSVDLLSSMKEHISALQKITSATVMFSGITERCVWRWGDGRKSNKARKFINSAMAQYTADNGGVFIDNKEIKHERGELFRISINLLVVKVHKVKSFCWGQVAEEPWIITYNKMLFRVIISPQNIQKVRLDPVPDSVDGLKLELKSRLQLKDPFDLQYEDEDFHDFCNLTCIADLSKDKTANQRMRTAALLGLPWYMRETPSKFLKICEPSDREEDEIKGVVIGILVVVENVMEPLPAFYNDVALVIEEEVVMRHLSDIPNAFLNLMGLVYALNLNYPRELKFTFEVIQRLFIGVGSESCTARVHSLKSKLLR